MSEYRVWLLTPPLGTVARRGKIVLVCVNYENCPWRAAHWPGFPWRK